ncbi:hypothetical protein [Niallia sp. 01092]|uniref:hypothetical protein n=1 Tax=unclassified Niallia TaxID=2837522 RepID=UPI003FD00AF0
MQQLEDELFIISNSRKKDVRLIVKNAYVRIDNFKNRLLAKNISGAGDGDNNEAEFYVRVYQAYTDDYILLKDLIDKT